MSTTRVDAPPAARADPSPVDLPPEPGARRPRVAMKWKLLGAFAGAFTIVFGFIAVWVIQDAGNKARERLVSELTNTAIGGARSIDAVKMRDMLATVPPVSDPEMPSGYGYPDSTAYRQLARQLFAIRDMVPEANPYTYYLDPTDGRLHFATSSGYYYIPQFGVTYKEPVEKVVSPDTYERMERGLISTTQEPPYTDAYGSWMSVYSPILTDSGKLVGASGSTTPWSTSPWSSKRCSET